LQERVISLGLNQGPLSDTLRDTAKARVDALRTPDPGNRAPIPVDFVTASGSGLDPHISPAAAQYQASRVARARGMQARDVQALIEQHTQGRQFGLLGEPRVNVLELNRALDGRTRR
jgi:K+-transporting ATPase ATPase C chain